MQFSFPCGMFYRGLWIVFFGSETSKQSSDMVTTLCLVNASLRSLSLMIDSSSLCVLLMSLSLSSMAPPLFSHVGFPRLFLFGGSVLNFCDVTSPLISHVEFPISDIFLVQDQCCCLAGTSTVLCRGETMQSQLQLGGGGAEVWNPQLWSWFRNNLCWATGLDSQRLIIVSSLTAKFLNLE